jgi:hypothetical protein
MAWGDPIQNNGGQTTLGGNVWEFVDVVGLDDTYALASGQGGYALIDLATGTQVWAVEFTRTYDIAWDPSLEHAYLGTRLASVYIIDLSDRSSPAGLGVLSGWQGVHEDLAADAGRVLVAAPETGAVLIDGTTGLEISTIPADWVASVALHGDRAVVGDRNEIVLYDLGDPGLPIELDRVSVRATARDLVFDGETIGVAMGGYGAAVIRVVDDQLELDGQLDLPGTTYGVALDDDRLWTASWSDVGLIWLGAGGPVVLGTEAMTEFTLGIGAAGGRAVASDWYGTIALEHIEGVAGPEIVLPVQVYTEVDEPQASIVIANMGAMSLEATASTPDPDAVLSKTTFVLEPGESDLFTLSGDGARPLSTTVELASNDPDEPIASVVVKTGSQSVGQPHEDFTLEGYQHPDSNLTPYTLSDQTGRVTFLAYFALY